MQIWTDPRYEAIPEPKRMQLFRDFKEVLRGAAAYEAQQPQQRAQPQPQAAARAAPQRAAASEVGAAPCWHPFFKCHKTAPACLGCAMHVRHLEEFFVMQASEAGGLGLLADEQKRLQSEYDRMEVPASFFYSILPDMHPGCGTCSALIMHSACLGCHCMSKMCYLVSQQTWGIRS